MQHELHAELAEAPAPNEPKVEKIERVQPLAGRPANQNAPAAAPVRQPPDGIALLRYYHGEQSWGGDRARLWRSRLTPEELAALEAAEEHVRRHGPLPHPMEERWRIGALPAQPGAKAQ